MTLARAPGRPPLLLCARSQTAPSRSGTVGGKQMETSIAMTMLTSRAKTQSRAFCQDAYPMPIVGLALAGLLLGDVAVVLAALAAIG